MMCPFRRSIGSWKNGAMAKYIAVPAKSCFKVDGPPSIDKAVYEPAACCVRAAHEIGEVTGSDVVLVSGAGLIGQICAQLCRRAGTRVVVAGLPSDAERLALAKSLGADAVADSADAIGKALEELGVAGFTLCIECAGAAVSLNNCIRYSSRHGRVVQVGLFGKDIPVNIDAALFKEVRLLTSFGSNPSSWRKMLGLIGDIDLSPFLSHVLPLSEWEQAFRDAVGAKFFKVLMTTDGEG